MNALQRNQVRASEIRSRLNELSGMDELEEEHRAEMDRLATEYTDVEAKIRAGTIAQDEADEALNDDTGEGRELRALSERVELRNYAQAAHSMQPVQGAEAEYNQALGMTEPGAFPLSLLADVEHRAKTDTDTTVRPQTWLDRLFADTAAMRLGITMPSVAPGIASFPITKTGPTPAQRGREEAATDGAWTVTASELKPTRNSVRVVFTTEDSLRIPGLESALRRDIADAMTEAIDRAIFLGDAGANENSADITGLQTHASVAEVEINQTNKVKADETLKVFTGLVDGKHAGGLGDLNVVASVGAYQLWTSTIANSAAENQTIGQFLIASGLSYGVRGEIETATAAGDFGAFIGLNRGIMGAGVAPVWESGQLIRDIYSKSASGEVALTLSYYWNFGLPRASNFRRLKFVAD